MRIGIFGGTFDPPHNGHINLAKEILKLRIADRIIFVLSASPPHKPGKKISSFQHRLKMLELVVRGIPEFGISDVEERRQPEPSYTIKTMEHFGQLYPDDDLYLIIGSDSLLQIHTWYMARELVARWNLITYPRPDEDATLDKLRQFWPEKTARKLYQSVINNACFDVSATEIRDIVASGRNLDNKFLSPEILDYILKNGLYRE